MYETTNTNEQTFKRLLVPSDLRLKVEDKDLGKFGLKKHVEGERIYYVFCGTYALLATIAYVA